jgi:hypothetical protein
MPVAAALAATALPRADMMHLAFVAALPAALCAAALSRLPPERAAGLAGVVFALGALALASNHLRGFAASERVNSPVGALLVDHDKSEALGQMLARVKPNDTLLVHPYMPVLYFATQVRNVSRLSFLNPGMMTINEEREVMAALKNEPLQWILHLALSREEFLRVFPHGTALDHRFPLVEAFLAEHYEPAASPPIHFSGYQLLRRKQPLVQAALSIKEPAR